MKNMADSGFDFPNNFSSYRGSAFTTEMDLEKTEIDIEGKSRFKLLKMQGEFDLIIS
jgi:hypothetical protein